MDFLKGKKTYITALIQALINAATGLGYIDWTAEQLTAVNGFLVAAIAVWVSFKIERNS